MRGWLDTARLKLLLSALFLALLVPSVVLVTQVFAQLEYEGPATQAAGALANRAHIYIDRV